MFKLHFNALAVLALVAFAKLPAASAADFTFNHENLLGTSLELKVQTDSQADAVGAQTVVLEEIQRLSSILSMWESSSELSRLLASPPGVYPVSADLYAVLSQSDSWQKETQGAFNPRVQVLSHLWSHAEQSQNLPARAAVELAKQGVMQPAWELTPEPLKVRVTGKSEVTLSALAKAYILDQAGDKAFQQLPGGSTLLFNIGGDIRHWGQQPMSAGVVDPHADEENRAPLSRVSLLGQALASSGNYRRGWDIAGVHYSHVLDPRTGQPVTGVVSTTVMAADAMTANALAVSISVLGAEEGLRLISNHPGAECMIISPTGAIRYSSGWPAMSEVAALDNQGSIKPEAAATAAAVKVELLLTFEFPAASKRPYIAAWVADSDGFPVRTLLLWIEQGSKRRKWLPDLRQWYRDDKTRQLVDSTDLVETRSSATRRAGQYSVVWNGADDSGKPVPTGSYTLILEAAREKGTHQVIKHPFEWNGKPFSAELPANKEISSAKVECTTVH